MFLCFPGRADESSAAAWTLALIPQDSATQVAADELLAELSGHHGWRLVEREALDAVLEEIELTLAKGVEDLAERIRLGRLVGADVMVLISGPDAAAEQDDKRWSLRYVATDSGVVLASERYRQDTPWVEAAVATLAQVRHAIPEDGPGEMIRLAVASPNLLLPAKTEVEAELHRLRVATVHRLAALPGVAVLERFDMQRLALEKTIDPQREGPYWTGTHRLEIAVDPAAAGEGYWRLKITLRPPGDGRALTYSVDAETTQFDLMSQKIVERVRDWLMLRPSSEAWDPLLEGERLNAEAWIAARAWAPAEVVQGLADSAYALGDRSDRTHLLRARSRGRRLLPRFQPDLVQAGGETRASLDAWLAGEPALALTKYRNTFRYSREEFHRDPDAVYDQRALPAVPVVDLSPRLLRERQAINLMTEALRFFCETNGSFEDEFALDMNPLSVCKKLLYASAELQRRTLVNGRTHLLRSEFDVLRREMRAALHHLHQSRGEADAMYFKRASYGADMARLAAFYAQTPAEALHIHEAAMRSMIEPMKSRRGLATPLRQHVDTSRIYRRYFPLTMDWSLDQPSPDASAGRAYVDRLKQDPDPHLRVLARVMEVEFDRPGGSSFMAVWDLGHRPTPEAVDLAQEFRDEILNTDLTYRFVREVWPYDWPRHSAWLIGLLEDGWVPAEDMPHLGGPRLDAEAADAFVRALRQRQHELEAESEVSGRARALREIAEMLAQFDEHYPEMALATAYDAVEQASPPPETNHLWSPALTGEPPTGFQWDRYLQSHGGVFAEGDRFWLLMDSQQNLKKHEPDPHGSGKAVSLMLFWIDWTHGRTGQLVGPELPEADVNTQNRVRRHGVLVNDEWIALTRWPHVWLHDRQTGEWEHLSTVYGADGRPAILDRELYVGTRSAKGSGHWSIVRINLDDHATETIVSSRTPDPSHPLIVQNYAVETLWADPDAGLLYAASKRLVMSYDPRAGEWEEVERERWPDLGPPSLLGGGGFGGLGYLTTRHPDIWDADKPRREDIVTIEKGSGGRVRVRLTEPMWRDETGQPQPLPDVEGQMRSMLGMQGPDLYEIPAGLVISAWTLDGLWFIPRQNLMDWNVIEP
ncbi:MAG: CsgG/HfaB family protein [Planctomycetota bacterium]